MTVFEASIKLYGWFSDHDTFCMASDHKELTKGEKRQDNIEASLQCALKDLERLELISKAECKGEDVWVLKRNYLTVEQEVKLTADTCLAISEMINTFCDVIKDEQDKCNPAEIEEKDIKSLIFICTYFIDQNKGKL
tara:strand:+ start:1015 stop:1425 length:411 start_codon:yes stop_codon:yes gene_type:complete